MIQQFLKRSFAVNALTAATHAFHPAEWPLLFCLEPDFAYLVRFWRHNAEEHEKSLRLRGMTKESSAELENAVTHVERFLEEFRTARNDVLVNRTLPDIPDNLASLNDGIVRANKLKREARRWLDIVAKIPNFVTDHGVLKQRFPEMITGSPDSADVKLFHRATHSFGGLKTSSLSSEYSLSLRNIQKTVKGALMDKRFRSVSVPGLVKLPIVDLLAESAEAIRMVDSDLCLTGASIHSYASALAWRQFARKVKDIRWFSSGAVYDLTTGANQGNVMTFVAVEDSTSVPVVLDYVQIVSDILVTLGVQFDLVFVDPTRLNPKESVRSEFSRDGTVFAAVSDYGNLLSSHIQLTNNDEYPNICYGCLFLDNVLK